MLPVVVMTLGVALNVMGTPVLNMVIVCWAVGFCSENGWLNTTGDTDDVNCAVEEN